MKQSLITALPLVGVTAQSSDTAVIEAVQNHIQALEQERDNAVNALSAQTESQIKTVLDQHQEAGTFDEKDRDTYAKIGKTSGIEALQTVLGVPKSQQAAPNISGMIQKDSENSAERANWSFDDWQKNDRKGLEALAEKDPAKFNQLFNAKYKKD